MSKIGKLAKRLHRAEPEAWAEVRCPTCHVRLRVLKSDGVAAVRDLLRDCPGHVVSASDADQALRKFFKRQIWMAMFEATRVKGVLCPYPMALATEFDEMCAAHASTLTTATRLWDEAIMARAWITRTAPLASADPHGWLVSFDAACESLGVNADHERLWMLEKIDACADFDTPEVYQRIDYLTANPPDEVVEALFDAPRCVPELDQGSLFGMFNAA